MKKLLLFILFSFNICFSQISTVPSPPEANAPITIKFNKTGTALASYTGTIYAHIGLTVDGQTWQYVIGNWGNNDVQPALTLESGTTYKLEITPDLYSYFGVPTDKTITQICAVFRNAAGNAQWPTNNAQEYTNVGSFHVNLTTPLNNSTTVIAQGSNLNVAATNTGGVANYTLKANNTIINTSTNTSTYNYTHTGITTNQNYVLEVVQGSSTITKKFNVVVNAGAVAEAMSSGLVDGINYDLTDTTKATLVLNAPNKDFVYVAGSFNGWNPNSSYAMKKDPTSGKFWLTITGLNPGTVYSYQYWVGDQTNLPANSPALVKTADPFSTLVLSPFDDGEIANLGVYPNLPQYPEGQEREVTVLQTGNNAHYSYNWSDATLNFVKPSKKDLVIYEVLVRDFDSNRSYQDLIDKIDYFKNLKINAIQLMPVMEFEGNESWGYNTVFHMALDKRYGTEAKLKEFIDLCHQNGIAVILDIALNHVYGRSPLERMWMLDSDGDGWANGSGPRTSAENPYCNQNAMHSYNVGTDLNHFREPNNLTNYYVTRTIQHWIRNFKIDGFRWDLTKGFTQNCPYTGSGSNQDACTNNYQADRVGKLKWYADLQWNEDPNFYVIFEHLGNGGSYNEEVEWANYRKNGEADGISKGIMQWRKMTDPYANFLKGNSTNLSGVTDPTNQFIGYAESHDEERVVYKALTEAGQTQGNLPKVLKRLSAMGAVHLLVPGPKMIYHFGDLGYDDSIFTCNNGTVNNPNCKLDTKPQPQWTENWLGDVARSKVYNDWAKMNELRINENVFENGQFNLNSSVTGRIRLDVWTSNVQTSNLSYVIVLTNSTNSVYNANGNFPFTGTWYNLMTGEPISVTSTSTTVSIEADGFVVLGNKMPELSIPVAEMASVKLYPNPANNYFIIDGEIVKAEIFSVTGQLVKSFNTITDSSYQFDISDLNQGVYLVKVQNNAQQFKTIKLIKP